MELRPLILGWLLEGPCHGYELLQRLVPFEPGSAGLNGGRVYKLLGELEEEGLTRHLLVPQKRVPNRKVLRLTRAGKTAFFDWMQNPPLQEGSAKYDFFLRDPFLVRLFFAHHLGRGAERELIRRHIQEIESRIREFTRLRKGAAAFPSTPRRLEILVLGLEYLVTKLRWLRPHQARVERSAHRRQHARTKGRRAVQRT